MYGVQHGGRQGWTLLLSTDLCPCGLMPVGWYQEVGKSIMISQITSTGIRVGMMAFSILWHKKGKVIHH